MTEQTAPMTEAEQKAAQLHATLRQFNGCETPIRHSMARRLCFTDGINYLRQKASAFWLVDAIASYFRHRGPIDRAREQFRSLHFWTLERAEGAGARLIAREDSGMPAVVLQEIPYTDFPFPADGEFTLNCAEVYIGEERCWLLMLPSEA